MLGSHLALKGLRKGGFQSQEEVTVVSTILTPLSTLFLVSCSTSQPRGEHVSPGAHSFPWSVV